VVYSANKVTTLKEDSGDLSHLQVKLIDFGFSHVSVQGEAKLQGYAGTPYYIAPEIIKDEKYGSKCDIWSLGILTYKLISGEYPFTAPNCNIL